MHSYETLVFLGKHMTMWSIDQWFVQCIRRMIRMWKHHGCLQMTLKYKSKAYNGNFSFPKVVKIRA